MIRAANAPCSWGVLEFGSEGRAPGAAQVLDEIASTGYAGTELGDWGFLPTDPARLRQALAARSLDLVGAFVPVALPDRSAHDTGEELAIKTARLLASTVIAGGTRPRIVLSDATVANPQRAAQAGRITAADGLSPAAWQIVAEGAERIARAVLQQTGLRTVFHHHCGTYVETPWEIAELMARTSNELLGLCLDTGHATYGGGNALELLAQHRDRIDHVHFKDCDPSVAAAARQHQWDYIQAVRAGVFCELGRGSVDFPAIGAALQRTGYDGWIVVEQDVLPSMGSPAESALRNRAFLRRLSI
jgi:inosose dehydratase